MILSKAKIDSVDIDKLIESKILASRFEELLIIVPTNRKLRSLKKELIDKTLKKSASQINIETLSTLSKKLLNISKPFVDLSEATSTILIKQSSEEVKLNYFSVYNKKLPFGTLDRIKNVISEYKKNGVTPKALLEEAKRLDKLSMLKAIDIANIYQTYKNKCSELNAFEIGDVYSKLIRLGEENVINNFRNYFTDVNLIIINGFDTFYNLEIELINFLSNIDKCDLIIDLDYYYKNKELFSHFDNVYNKLRTKQFNVIKDISPYYHNQFKSRIIKNLFEVNTNRLQERSPFPIKLIKGNSKEDEVEKIAKVIKYLLLHENIKPHEICVVFNLVKNYSPIVRNKFESFGIPTNLTDRIPLDQSPPITLIVNVLEVLQNDFYYKSIFRAFTSNLSVGLDLDLDNLLKIAKSLKIVAGKENWISSINNSIAVLQYQQFDNEEESNQKLNELTKALNDIKKVYKVVKTFDRKMTISEFLNELKNLVYNLKIFDIVLSESNENTEATIKALTTFFETVDEIFNLLKHQYGEEQKFELKFYLDNIRTAAGWARFNIKERSDYGVLVTSIDEIRGLRFKFVFIGGMNDGEFPTKYSPEIFYSGSFMKNRRNHQLEERYRFYQAVTALNKGLYFSYALKEETKELVESSFIKDFNKLFFIEVTNDSDFQNVIYSDEELLSLYGEKYPQDDLDEILIKRKFNPVEIEKKIKIDRKRIKNPYEVSDYNGVLITDEDKEIDKFLISHTMNQFSITQLETYAKCPFRYYLMRILNLEELTEPSEDIDALEMGSFLHNVLFEFYSELKNRNLVLQNTDDRTFKIIKEIIFSIANKNFEKMNLDPEITFLEKEKIFGLNGNETESILFRFLQTERESVTGFIPKYFEVGFGRIKKTDSDKTLSTFQPIELGKVKLRGKIDRIDVDENENYFNVIDYKTGGRKPPLEDIQLGISLQLPVYLYATKILLARFKNSSYKPLGMIIYSLKYNKEKFGPIHVKLTKKRKISSAEIVELNEKQILTTRKLIENYVSDIRSGKFNLTTLEDKDKKVCGFCKFYSICRIRELVV